MLIVQYYCINIVNCKNIFPLSVVQHIWILMYYDIYIEKLIKVIIIFEKHNISICF